MQYTQKFKDAIMDSKFVKNLQNGIVQMDNSEFGYWDGCHASGLYYGALRRVSARSRSPLAFGAAVHAGLEAFFMGRTTWLEEAFAVAAEEELDEMGDPKRNTRVLENLLTSYIMEYSRHRDMQFNIISIGLEKGVEKSFTVPLGSTQVSTKNFGGDIALDILWDGKVDLFTDYEQAVWPVDHKTTTVMGEKFIDDKVRSSQMLGYTYAGRYLSKSLLGDRPVGGCRINALAMRSSGFEFKTFDIPYADWKVAEWQAETIQAVEDAVHRLDKFISTGEVAPTRAHCVTKYGKCSYFDVCDTTPTMRDRMLFDDAYFYVSDWSPLGE